MKKVISVSRKNKIEQPKLPPSLIEGDFQDIYDQADSYINNCMIKNISIDGHIEGHIEFAQVVFKNVTFNDVSF